MNKKILLADITRVSENCSGVITRNYYRANGAFTETEWQKYFSTFSDFVKAAGLNEAEAVEPLTLDEQAQVVHLKAKNQLLESTVKSLLKERGKYTELVKDVKAAVTALDPLPFVDFRLDNKEIHSPVAAVFKFSDWQIGEVIEASETEGFGEFNHDIAIKRVDKLVTNGLEWTYMHRKAGYNLKEAHIFSEADLVSGNIHYELEVTNEFPVTVAAAKAGNLLASAIHKLAPHFDKITVWEMSADNHGRMTRKNQAKQGALNNWSYMAHVICNEIIRDHKNIEVNMGDGTKLLADVLGKKFLLSHGHHIMGQMGIPYYGMERDKAREAVKRAKLPEMMFDYISIGHWHVPAIISGNILVNGNLPGTTEFDHMQGRYAAPSQVSFMVHPKHGMFNWTAWKL